MYTRIIPAAKSSTGKKVVERNLSTEDVIGIMSINGDAIVINQDTGKYVSCIWYQGEQKWHLRDAMCRYHVPTRIFCVLRSILRKFSMKKLLRKLAVNMIMSIPQKFEEIQRAPLWKKIWWGIAHFFSALGKNKPEKKASK